MPKALSTAHFFTAFGHAGPPLSAQIMLLRSHSSSLSGVQRWDWHNLIYGVLDSTRKIDKFCSKAETNEISACMFHSCEIARSGIEGAGRGEPKAVIHTRRVRNEHHRTLCRGRDCLRCIRLDQEQPGHATDKITWPTVPAEWSISPLPDTGSNLAKVWQHLGMISLDLDM